MTQNDWEKLLDEGEDGEEFPDRVVNQWLAVIGIMAILWLLVIVGSAMLP